MDTSWKFSRISAAATVAAAHVLLVFLLAAVLAARTEPEGPSVEPLLVKLENRPARLPAPPDRSSACKDSNQAAAGAGSADSDSDRGGS